ncbi:MAG: hypothetical protein KBT29_11025, partial [Prevotellaceae bacterium]|nr:hypothetical protein [Candidatus Minthosoma caballi]
MTGASFSASALFLKSGVTQSPIGGVTHTTLGTQGGNQRRCALFAYRDERHTPQQADSQDINNHINTYNRNLAKSAIERSISAQYQHLTQENTGINECFRLKILIVHFFFTIFATNRQIQAHQCLH